MLKWVCIGHQRAPVAVFKSFTPWLGFISFDLTKIVPSNVITTLTWELGEKLEEERRAAVKQAGKVGKSTKQVNPFFFVSLWQFLLAQTRWEELPLLLFLNWFNLVTTWALFIGYSNHGQAKITAATCFSSHGWHKQEVRLGFGRCLTTIFDMGRVWDQVSAALGSVTW